MPHWTPQNLGEPLSEIVTKDDAQDEAILGHQSGAVVPSFFPLGGFWFQTNYPVLGNAVVVKLQAGTALLMDPDFPQLNAGGTVAWSNHQNAGGRRLTNLALATAASDAPRRDQVDLRDGSQAWTGHHNAGARRLENLSAPINPNDAARLADVGGLLFAGRHYYNTNRDILGNGHPVQVELQTDKPNSSTICGTGNAHPGIFTPRRLRVRIYGDFCDQDDNDQNGPANQTLEFDVWRWQADGVGGDPGTPGTVQVADIAQVGKSTVRFEVEWRYGPADKLGFWLRFYRLDNGVFQRIRNPANNAIDGTIQVQAFFGQGT